MTNCFRVIFIEKPWTVGEIVKLGYFEKFELSIPSDRVFSGLSENHKIGPTKLKLRPIEYKNSRHNLNVVQYLGSVIIKQLHGKQSAEEACLKLKGTVETMFKKPDIILAISWKGIKFVDASTKVL